MGRSSSGHSEVASVNEVLLVGRLAAAAQTIVLPSGDVIAQWRVVVGRPPPPAFEARRGRGVGVDTFDCRAASARVRRQAATWLPGDVLRIEGTLRRRFWRSAGGAASRHEVEVLRVSRVGRAG
jgi:single-strand DNA-binding protein